MKILMHPHFEIRWSIETAIRDGFEWQTWRFASWHWQWSFPWFYCIYYDGDWYYSLHCGIGVWCFGYDCDCSAMEVRRI